MAEEESILDPEIERLSERLGKDPDSLVFAPLADAYRRSGLIEEAIDVLRKGMEKHPNYASAFIVLGRCYQDQKMYELARSEFEKALEVDRDNLLASKLYAAVLVPLGRKGEAIERYKRLLENDPVNVEIRGALEDLESQADAEESTEDLGGSAETSMFSFGDIGAEDTGKSAPSFADILPGGEPEDIGPGTVDSAPEAGPDLGGRSPFDFGSIPDATGEETGEPEESQPPPAFLEPTVIESEGIAARKHDLGGGADMVADEPAEAEEKKETEEIVLPKPTGKTVFAAPPGLDASIGRKIDSGLAEIYTQQGFVDKAIETYRRLIEINPGRDDYRRRLAELEGRPGGPEEETSVFPSEILEPFSDTTTPGEAASPADDEGFSDAATPEDDQTISLSDLFSGKAGADSPGGSPEPPGPSPGRERMDESGTEEKGTTKGGFDSFQSWLDGLGK